MVVNKLNEYGQAMQEFPVLDMDVNRLFLHHLLVSIGTALFHTSSTFLPVYIIVFPKYQ